MDHEEITPNFSFGIENTSEMGIGSPELLQGLMSPETSTSNPDDLESIEKKPEVSQDKPIKEKTTVEKDNKEDGSQNILSEYLLGSDEEEEETTEDAVEKPEVAVKKETKEEETFSQFTALAKDLFKLGVFSKEDDEDEVQITTAEEFLDRFNVEKEKGAVEMVNNFVGKLGEDYQNAFEAIFVKGVRPDVYFGVYNNVVNFAELDMSVEENQIAVMRRSLSDQEMDPEDIDAEIQRLKTYADLEAASIRHQKVLVKKEAAKLQQLEQESERELQQKAFVKKQFEQNVQNVLQEKLKAKEFDGIPINAKLATELQDFLLTDRWRLPSGETITEFDRQVLELKRPENHAQKVKLALILKILEKDPTLSTVQRAGVTKKSDQLFAEVTKQSSIGKEAKAQDKPKSWFQ